MLGNNWPEYEGPRSVSVSEDVAVGESYSLPAYYSLLNHPQVLMQFLAYQYIILIYTGKFSLSWINNSLVFITYTSHSAMNSWFKVRHV